MFHQSHSNADPLAVEPGCESSGSLATAQVSRLQVVDPVLHPIRYQIGMSGPVYLMGFLGTVLAGALFPMVFSILRCAILGKPGLLFRLDFFASSAIGALYGAVLAGIAAAAVFPVAAAIQFLSGLHGARAVMASVAGGWSGVVATLTVFTRPQDPDRQFASLTAMLMGQVLAGLAARDVQLKQDYVGIWADPPKSWHFSLRHLLRLTAATALLAAILARLPLPESVVRDIGCAVGFQTLVMFTYFVVVAIRARLTLGDND